MAIIPIGWLNKDGVFNWVRDALSEGDRPVYVGAEFQYPDAPDPSVPVVLENLEDTHPAAPVQEAAEGEGPPA